MGEETVQLKRLTAPLLAWYDGHRRILPWREEVSPYRTWVSEIMLQQTRVAAVLPYFDRFLAALPDTAALAAVDEEKLLKLWEGLGYYSRARNLRRAAGEILERFGGVFPDSYEALRSLPGIGDYTAGAILSIAFGKAVPAVDGNVLRIVARVTGSDGDIMDAAVRKQFRALVAESMSAERPGAYNQALMDLGATVCLPGAPDCGACPAADFCAARRSGRTGELPVRSAKKPRRTEEKTVLLLLRGDRAALRKRPAEGLLAGLWEFPWLSGARTESETAAALAEWGLTVTDWKKRLAARHIFTHLVWHMTVYVLAVRGEGPADWRWCGAEDFGDAAVPSAYGRPAEELRRLWKEQKQGEDERDGTALL